MSKDKTDKKQKKDKHSKKNKRQEEGSDDEEGAQTMKRNPRNTDDPSNKIKMSEFHKPIFKAKANKDQQGHDIGGKR